MLDDITNDRQKSQFRIHFPIGTDYDTYMDGVSFTGIEYPFLYQRPKLIVEYRIPNIGIENQFSTIPEELNIIHTYPNPFNAYTIIDYEISKPGLYTLTIFDLSGRNISVLKSDFHPTGHYSVSWNGKTHTGADVPSGVYFFRLTDKDQSLSKKLVLLR